MSKNINHQLGVLRNLRYFTLNTIKDLTVEQLNKVPEGYNNNIIWNLAHLVAAQEGLCYLRAGQQPNVAEEFLNNYKSGSKPSGSVDEDGITTIKQLLLTSVDDLERDLLLNKFENYNAWKTRYNIEMNTIDDAINFLPFHEGMHLGYIMALKRNQELI